MGPIPLARARDLYRNGKGNMLVKAASLVTVVDGQGEEMDPGSMMRYLSEMSWYSSAFLRGTCRVGTMRTSRAGSLT